MVQEETAGLWSEEVTVSRPGICVPTASVSSEVESLKPDILYPND